MACNIIHLINNNKINMDRSIIKPVKGMKDLTEEQINLRNNIIGKLINIFKKYGGNQIETPVVENIEIVNDLYGEEFEKQVFMVTNKNSKKQLMLRYDLTIPFIRYIASNGITKFRGFRIGKVYRGDNPNIKQGRYREFYSM